MSGGKNSKQTIGYRYYMSLHMGLCRGPIDEIVQINVGDVRAWPVPDGDSEQIGGLMTTAQGPDGMGVSQFENGTAQVVPAAQINTWSGNGQTRIDASKLFGGDKKEGGISGTLNVLMGSAAQLVPPWIKALMGGRVPDFRGVATLFFDGLLTSLNPYPKKWTFRVRRTTQGWDGAVWQPSLATIWMRSGTIKAMNPAHILYECLTNRDWGRGLPRSVIKDDRWVRSATTLYNELFGLCLRYNRTSDLSEFIQNVLDHIGGAIYPDRTTGALALDLLRGDYDMESLPLFTYDSGLISIEDDETSAQDDLVNEVIINWTDPIEGKDRSARVHDLASHQSTGAINSSNTTLAGIPTSTLALRVAQRNLKAGAYSLKRYKLVLDRRAWRMVTGDVFRVSVPQRNIYNAVLRAGEIRSGSDTDGKITVKAVLDVFGMPTTSFISTQPNEWTPLSRSPVIADTRLVREATYTELVAAMGAGDAQTLDPSLGAIIVFAARPSQMSQGYNLRTKVDGSDTYTRGAGSFNPAATLAENISALQNNITFTDGADLGLVSVGDMVVFANEICRLTAISATDQTMTIARGCVDTIPKAHAAGEKIFIASTNAGGDGVEYAAGESVAVQILTFTSTAELAASLAPINNVNIVGRQGRPFAPGNVQVNGNPFTAPHSGSSIAITWAHRNRITQQDKLIPHGNASVTPEAGTTYTIRVYDGNTSTPVRTVTGIAGTSFTYTPAMATEDGTTNPWFELETVRGGFVSYNRYRFGATITT